ncbi:MAG: hypothetical protein QOJ81_2253 [Chloroflexota bacterium]|nr:hypothetical protein [Chloroflexota bacterium]
MAAWRFEYSREPDLPPLAWLATVDRGVTRVRCGTSVRCTPQGFVEGSWVGAETLASLPTSTAIFGSGIVADGDGFVVVPPSHPHERLYLHRPDERGQSWLVSNSLVWLLVAADLALDPAIAYPSLFTAASEYVRPPTAEIPTTTRPITAAVYDNFRLTADGALVAQTRPTERPFESYADYSLRIREALASAIANAPGYEMAVSLSSGYDSTAVAAIAAPLGCRRALTFAMGTSGRDSGAASAKRLGMSVESFDRLAYLSRDDLPEAEFLASGMSGEDVVLAPMAESLRRTLLLTGSEEFLLKGSNFRPELHRGDLSWCSVTEFRLRLDFVHVPLLFLGATEQPSLTRIIESPEMDPYRVSGRYDKPIQRRLAEEAGLPRGSFATVKRRASGAIHVDGLAAMSAASVASVRAYAARRGEPLPAQRRPPPRRLIRALSRVAKRLGMEPLADRLRAQRRSWIHLEPRLGSLLLRWSVDVVRPRYGGSPGMETYDRRR